MYTATVLKARQSFILFFFFLPFLLFFSSTLYPFTHPGAYLGMTANEAHAENEKVGCPLEGWVMTGLFPPPFPLLLFITLRPLLPRARSIQFECAEELEARRAAFFFPFFPPSLLSPLFPPFQYPAIKRLQGSI